ncbi:PREDICTED: LOW QUALITY PROTEIN: transcription factor bHLH106 [Tarenaya hassleriana]|uniref:LOW QUALITY PROTEIN: transcription factor bHLH106 n=1 Tax=Tarenaya hassleriana TaxID=28532 RepID=UPI00053C4EAC|nr:PREDICTED: LOW QUALITY PROTEIN: transcription factor bHLH106 [Tarenaya hassleriana]
MQPEDSNSEQLLYSLLAGNDVWRGGGGNATSSFCGSSTTSYYPLAISGIGETMAQDRALAALRNHKEAERRRRERINSHLNKLRTLLSCNSKTDKATLLAKVVQRVKELKQQTLEISEAETLPSETDEISVLHFGDCSSDGRIIFKASLCCDDRSDLLPDLTEILKSLQMKTLRAEMATVGGRTRSVLVVAADKEHGVESVHFLQNALKSLLERSRKSLMERSGGGGGDRSKRRRALEHIIMV